MLPSGMLAEVGLISGGTRHEFAFHSPGLRHANVTAITSAYFTLDISPRMNGVVCAGKDTRAIQAWMGHKNIQHTVCYTELAHGRGSGGIACRLEPIHQVEVGCDTHSRVPHWMYCSDFRGPPHMCSRPRLEGLEPPGS